MRLNPPRPVTPAAPVRQRVLVCVNQRRNILWLKVFHRVTVFRRLDGHTSHLPVIHA